MARQLFTNNAATHVIQFVSPTDTQIRVVDGSEFPTPENGDYFIATLIANVGNIDSSTMEIVKVTSNVDNVFTVERAQEGTSAKAFLFGCQIALQVTAGALNDLVRWHLFDGTFASVAWYVRPGDSDHTAAFERALDAADLIYFDSAHGPYELSGTISLPSNKDIRFLGCPTITIISDGEERGIWWPQGTENTSVSGEAYIKLKTDTAGSDGSFNGAFTFGQFYYTDDPLPIKACSITGPITIECIGSANSKPVSVYGWVEDCTIDGITAFGRTNFAFSAHWSGNGGVGVLPTKTWHPDGIYFKNCAVIPTPTQIGQTLRSFTASACGKLVLEDCRSLDVVTLGYNLFAGDYGYTYAQNITQQEAFNISIVRCLHTGTGIGLSVDGQTSGLNSSTIWTGTDNNARVSIDGLDVFIAPSATGTVGMAVSLINQLTTNNLRVIEQGNLNNQQSVTLFGVGPSVMNGQLVIRSGMLIRACADVDLANVSVTSPMASPESGKYGISLAASSNTATVSGGVAAAGTVITLSDNTLVCGAGGYLQYDDGSTIHEMEILTSTYSSGVQTISITPAPVEIPNGATITVIQTNKRLNIGVGTIRGYATGVRCTGSAIAKQRDLSIFASFERCGVYDIDLAAVDGVKVRTSHQDGGLLTSVANRYCINLTATSEMFDIQSFFGKTNTRIRYLISVDNSATNGIIQGCTFGSFDSTATSPAAVFLNTATNVVYVQANNLYGSGVIPKYPA